MKYQPLQVTTTLPDRVSGIWRLSVHNEDNGQRLFVVNWPDGHSTVHLPSKNKGPEQTVFLGPIDDKPAVIKRCIKDFLL